MSMDELEILKVKHNWPENTTWDDVREHGINAGLYAQSRIDPSVAIWLRGVEMAAIKAFNQYKEEQITIELQDEFFLAEMKIGL